ncbi:MAG TPA: myo-inositol catabolism protein, partial [Candidatus Competibacteraceae bacterium]|nr:myo-inositol catabolism protein [Candidatus Competibacteraceae bacterium]
MTLHITAHRDGFPPGLTWITTPWEAEDNTGIGLGVLHLGPGETWSAHSERETAWLLMAGQVEVSADGIG